jgi:hypothetical protein
MSDDRGVEIAKLAIHEAREELRMPNPKLNLIEPVLVLADKALAGEAITEGVLGPLHPVLADNVRARLGMAKTEPSG